MGRGYAAFAAEDLEDAKRGAPAVDLSGYARQRQLDFLGSARIGGFIAVTPLWGEYVFNAMSGIMPSGDAGILQHQLREIAVSGGGNGDDLEMGGPYWSVRVRATHSLLGIDRGYDNEPFAGNHVYVPTTLAAVRVPEIARLPRMIIRRGDRFPSWGCPNLKAHGVPGYRLHDEGVDRTFLDEFLRSGVGEIINSLPYPFVQVSFDHAQISLECNGFLRDPGWLDHLAHANSKIANAARNFARRYHAPQPFGQPLGAPPWADPGVEPQRLDMAEVYWHDAFRRVAAEQQMTLEDPDHLHAAFPTIGVPGLARASIFGTLAGTAALGRVAWFKEGLRANDAVRGAVLIEAAGRPDSRRGGTDDLENGMCCEVRDGIASLFALQPTVGALDSHDLIPRAIASARRFGLLPA